MKPANLFLPVALAILTVTCSVAQQTEETLIRNYEDLEREAILKSDTMQLYKLMSSKIVVQNPENAIVGYRQIIERIKSGKINYSKFERSIDKVTVVNGIAVVMGLETIIPQGTTQNAGKTVKRRFTNIWTKEDGVWKLTARQATIVSVE